MNMAASSGRLVYFCYLYKYVTVTLKSGIIVYISNKLAQFSDEVARVECSL